jgi:hypothetical protein
VSVISRSDSGQGAALAFVSPEALQEMAGDACADHPERVNGTKVHGPCRHCDEDGQV